MQIIKSDLDSAVKNSIITPEQAQQLWAHFENQRPEQAKFQTLHILYYFGGLLILASMTWFLSNAWDDGRLLMLISGLFAAAYVALASKLWSKPNLKIPAGLIVTAAVALTPVFTYGLQQALGFAYGTRPYEFETLTAWFKSSWFLLEVATVVTSLIALRYFKFALLTLPLTIAVWCFAMDVTSYIYGASYTHSNHRIVSCFFGLAVILASYFLNKKYKQPDYAFWTYLYAASAFWFGLTLLDSDSEVGKFIYCLINIKLIFFSVYIRRRIFMIYGSLGVMIYLGHLAWKVFKDSYAFPVVLALLGLAIVFVGIKYQKNKAAIEAKVESWFPDFLMKWRPEERA